MFAASKTDGATTAANFIEDVFSVYLYSGTGSSQTITNNIDTTTYGGLVWIKGRSGATGHRLTDTVRGTTKSLASNDTAAEATESTGLTAFGTTGFTIGADADYNTNAATYASWTFRKQAKFFDVVTYTGNGANRTIAHNLGSVPGCIMVKRTDTTGAWAVYHRSLANTEYLVLNTTAAKATGATYWNSTTPTSTEFSLGTATDVNANTGTYVAYLFAHDAGGFGAAGSDNVISCGSYTGDGTSTKTINLGYEPQLVLIKRTDDSGYDWYMEDVMRGLSITNSNYLKPNTSGAEAGNVNIYPTATGFTCGTGLPAWNASGGTYIYIAIRRGPMKTPTSGTSVFSPVLVSQADTQQTSGGSFPPDFVFMNSTNGTSRTTYVNQIADRLRSLGTPSDTFSTTTDGVTLTTSSTAAEDASNAYIQLKANGIDITRGTGWNSATFGNFIYYLMRRAPGFFDVVCYTGTGSNRTVTHNLTVAPELMIVKLRSGAFEWQVYSSGIANTEYLMLDSANAKATGATRWNSTTPTSSVFSLGTAGGVNSNGSTYVAYLFATLAGVSKVGSYTGSGTTKQIDCGFAAGARFVLIKRTDSAGDWYVWDTARGIVSGNDPYLLLNSSGAETTNTDYIDPLNAGFEISSTAPAAINANGGTYIFWAVA